MSHRIPLLSRNTLWYLAIFVGLYLLFALTALLLPYLL